MARTPKTKLPPPPPMGNRADEPLELFVGSDDEGFDPFADDTVSSLPLPDILPLVPIRDNVYFPHLLFPLFIGRDRSVRAVEAAMESPHRCILLAAQRDVLNEDPGPRRHLPYWHCCRSDADSADAR